MKTGKLVVKVMAGANDPERCFRYARDSKQVTLAGHTWDRQVGRIVEAAEAVR